MEVPIYVDVLFVINLFINYFLLLLSARFSLCKINRWKILFGSILGSIYSCIIFFCNFSSLIVLLIKIVSAFLIAWVSLAPKTKKDLLRTTIVFLISNFILGGVCYAVYFLSSPTNMTLRNTIVYFNISPIYLIILTIFTYLITIVLESILKPQHLSINNNYSVTIYYHGKFCTLKGFVDTGNNLTDFFTNTPIIVCSFASIEKILNDNEKYVFNNFDKINDIPNYMDKIRIVPINTVNSRNFLPAFVPEKLIINNLEKTYSIRNVLIAVSNENHLNDQPVILNPKLIYE